MIPTGMLYFAYGSNLCSGWLLARTKSARYVSVARLEGYTPKFHKWSACDRSGKADAFRTGEGTDIVWGVLVEMDPRDRRKLGRLEGGYDDREVEVIDRSDGRVTAFTYLARDRWISTTPRFAPFCSSQRLPDGRCTSNSPSVMRSRPVARRPLTGTLLARDRRSPRPRFGPSSTRCSARTRRRWIFWKHPWRPGT